MELEKKITECYASSKNYPELVKNLIDIGVLSYTVDVATSIILYRFSDGKTILHPSNTSIRMIALNFNKEKTIEGVRNNQQGKTDYPGFMNEIASAGVRFYEATINGTNKRVTYIGTGGFYEESIPV